MVSCSLPFSPRQASSSNRDVWEIQTITFSVVSTHIIKVASFSRICLPQRLCAMCLPEAVTQTWLFMCSVYLHSEATLVNQWLYIYWFDYVLLSIWCHLSLLAHVPRWEYFLESHAKSFQTLCILTTMGSCVVVSCEGQSTLISDSLSERDEPSLGLFTERGSCLCNWWSH